MLKQVHLHNIQSRTTLVASLQRELQKRRALNGHRRFHSGPAYLWFRRN